MSAKLLQRTLRGGDRLVSPFLILGDPTPARSVDLCVALVRSGAGMLELVAWRRRPMVAEGGGVSDHV